jgi:hypothetical protein
MCFHEFMPRKKKDQKVPEPEKRKQIQETQYQQLQLFAAFRDIWEAPVR